MPSRKLVIGPVDAPIITFEDPKIRSVIDESAVSLIGNELSTDVLEPVVEYEIYIDYNLVSSDGFTLVSSDGYELRPYANYDLRRLPYGTKLTYLVDGRVQGEFYSQKVQRTGKTKFKIPAVSEIGLMTTQPSLGGIYTGQKFGAVLAEILGEGHNYSITDDAANLTVYGWLPYSTRRKNLHQLVTAYGVNIIRSDTGGMLFTILANTTPETIDMGNTYIGGNVDYGDPASRVEVTEHAYFYLDTVAEETVFDNTKSDAVTSALITFKQPFYPDSLRCSEGSLTIEKSGVNYVIVSGVGILVGKPYTHTTRIVARDNPNAMTENVKQLKDATLVTVANSDNVLLRMAEYYFNATVFNSSVKLTTEKCGRRYTMYNAFGERRTAFLTKISANASSITKADCEFIADYVPRAQGSTYSNVVLLTAASGTWTVPQEVKDKEIPNIRVVLIGGGETGKKGSDGQAGTRATDTSPGKGGLGGEGGQPGKGGKIYSATIDCTDIETFSFGRSGLNTWIKGGGYELNSDDGASSDSGFLDVFTGTVYALPGKPGQAGAPGGKGGKYTHSTSGVYAEAGSNVTYNGRTYKGGAPGTRALLLGANLGISSSMEVYAARGGGSGAAVGTAGKKAPDGKSNPDSSGADGVKPVKADAASKVPGSGGNGGHGGSGGGGGGITEYFNADYSTVISTQPYSGGAKGPGGDPSDGAPGAILIYY